MLGQMRVRWHLKCLFGSFVWRTQTTESGKLQYFLRKRWMLQESLLKGLELCIVYGPNRI